jgi:hypothetical protein
MEGDHQRVLSLGDRREATRMTGDLLLKHDCSLSELIGQGRREPVHTSVSQKDWPLDAVLENVD